jgi:hypothetical protein
MLHDLFQRNARLSALLGSLIASLMLACAVVPVARIFEVLSPGWPGTFLVAACFLIALEAMFSRRALRGRSFPQPEWLRYRLSEWILILLGLKLLLYAAFGFDTLALDLSQRGLNFFSFFFSDDYVIILMVGFIVWMLGGNFAEELDLLEADETLLLAEGRSGAVFSRNAARRRLVNMILIIGGVMLFMTAVLRSDLGTPWFALPALQLGFFNIMLYFLLSLVLLSLTQFSILRVGWLHEGAPLQPGLAGRWFIYSSIFLAVLALISFSLPTGYSLGLLAFLRLVLSITTYGISLIGFIITLPLMLLMVFLARLFNRPEMEQPLPELPGPVQLPPQTPGSPLPWLELLKGLLFWLFFFVVVLYALRQYLRDHPEITAALRRYQLFRLLGSLWQAVRGWVSSTGERVAAAGAGVRDLFSRRISKPSPLRGSFVNPRRLPARQQVIFYYLAMLRRARERGIPRGPAETPYEYALQLESQLNEKLEGADEASSEASGASESVESLTERFMDARYSLHPVTPEETGLARRYWERIRQALQKIH